MRLPSIAVLLFIPLIFPPLCWPICAPITLFLCVWGARTALEKLLLDRVAALRACLSPWTSSISVTNISASHCSKFIVSVRFCHPVEGVEGAAAAPKTIAYFCAPSKILPSLAPGLTNWAEIIDGKTTSASELLLRPPPRPPADSALPTGNTHLVACGIGTFLRQQAN